MTAAPGPQQPDEVRWAIATEVASRYFDQHDDEYRDLLADVHAALCGHIAPAAPSAQPDRRWHTDVGDPADRMFIGPAQPNRVTEQGAAQ